MARSRRPTATTNFGSSRRESHDASAFYDRFVAPEVSADATVNLVPDEVVGRIHHHDARDMSAVPDSSVALVITSPPYFAGKQYEESLGVNGVPATYFEYLELLHDVFAECKRVLEPGGRIAVNVANLGRRPYRSLSGDVTQILSDLGLLLRGEVIWWKGRAAGGSCAWGTFQRPANPVLRDVTERVVIASKGRFDRANTPAQRQALGLPSTATITREEFMEATTDLWEIAPESATKVGHPAPFPVELPQRLIELHTYEGDVVLDPFMGSGSTGVAAVRTGRRHIGFDTDADYIATAQRRIDDERERLATDAPGAPRASDRGPDDTERSEADLPEGVEAAVSSGLQAKDVAKALLSECGFGSIGEDVKLRGTGLEVSLTAKDATGTTWGFEVVGSFSTNRAGLRRADALWRTLGKAAVVHESVAGLPLVVLTTDAPRKGTPGHQSLTTLVGPERPILDVVELLDPEDHARLRGYAQGRGA